MLLSRFSSGTHILKRFVEDAGSLADKKSESEFRDFFSSKKNIRQDIDRPIDKTAERIKINTKFMDANFK